MKQTEKGYRDYYSSNNKPIWEWSPEAFQYYVNDLKQGAARNELQRAFVKAVRKKDKEEVFRLAQKLVRDLPELDEAYDNIPQYKRQPRNREEAFAAFEPHLKTRLKSKKRLAAHA